MKCDRAVTRPLSDISRRVLARAAGRERGNICPIVDGRSRAASEMTIIYALLRRGFITDERVPYITEAGRKYLEETGTEGEQ